MDARVRRLAYSVLCSDLILHFGVLCPSTSYTSCGTGPPVVHTSAERLAGVDRVLQLAVVAVVKPPPVKPLSRDSSPTREWV